MNKAGRKHKELFTQRCFHLAVTFNHTKFIFVYSCIFVNLFKEANANVIFTSPASFSVLVQGERPEEKTMMVYLRG